MNDSADRVAACFAIGVEVPFGGNRKSGFGKEKGQEGLDAYLRTKTITARL